MINITDQLNLSNILTLEPRASNVIYVGPMIKVETIPEYLARVDINNRYLGLDVLILSPAGTYSVNSFMNLINLESIIYTSYQFKNNLNDLVEVSFSNVVINNLTSDSITSSLSAAQGKELKRLIDSRYYRHTQGVPQVEWFIAHGLGRNPSVTVTDSAGTVVEGRVQYVDTNNIIVTFSAAFSGYAELN